MHVNERIRSKKVRRADLALTVGGELIGYVPVIVLPRVRSQRRSGMTDQPAGAADQARPESSSCPDGGCSEG